jgi:hypothetical protein
MESPLVMALRKTTRDISAQLFHQQSLANISGDDVDLMPPGDVYGSARVK